MRMNVRFNPARVNRLFDSTIETRMLGRKSWDFVIGGDVGGTNIRFGIVSLRSGKLASEPRIIEMAKCTSYENLVREVNDAKKSLIESAGREFGSAATGFPAPVDKDGKVRFAPPNLTFQIDPDFGKHTDQEVFNDANAIAKGVAYFDPIGSTKESFVTILPGTGLGTAAIDGDHLVLPFAFEGGHIKIFDPFNKDLPVCGCGARGCAETFISGQGIMNTAKIMFETREIGWEKPEDITTGWMEADKTAKAVMNKVAENMVRFLSTTDAVFLPDAYFLGEGFLRLFSMGKKFIREVKEQLKHTKLISFERARVVSNNLSYIRLGHPGIKGAAVIAAEKIVGMWP